MENESDLALMLSDLANLYPSTESIHRLDEKWPGFLPRQPKFGIEITQHTPTGELIPLNVEKGLHYVIWLQNMVRDLWTGDSSDALSGKLETILLTGQLGLGNSPPLNFLNLAPLPGVIGLDLRHKRFEYRPQTLLQKALYYLLKNFDKAKVCANPDCPAPYFIAPRSNTKFCSAACVEEIRREAKRAWWENSGNEWREKRKKKKKKKRRRKSSPPGRQL
jgi:hypothetical protein